MPEKQKKQYASLVERFRRVLDDEDKLTLDGLKKAIEKTQLYLQAAGDMTKDELQLMATYLKRDLASAAQMLKLDERELAKSPSYAALRDGFWGWLLELSDRTQLEWQEVADDLKHKGVYKAGEMVGVGTLICEDCGHRQTVTHPQVLDECLKCGAKQFSRVPLEP